MEHSPSETYSHSSSPEIPRRLWNSEVLLPYPQEPATRVSRIGTIWTSAGRRESLSQARSMYWSCGIVRHREVRLASWKYHITISRVIMLSIF